MSSLLMRYCRSLGRYEAGLREALGAYASIVEPSMGFPREKELESSAASSRAAECHSACIAAQSLASAIEGASVCVVTPGPSLPSVIAKSCEVAVATDSSLELLSLLRIRPAALVGDADASLRLLHMAIQLDVPYLLHSHGDNVYRVAGLLRSLRPDRLIITSQVDTPCCALPVGAFTDGDRAAAIAMAFRARRVVMGAIEGEPWCGHKDHCEASAKRPKLELAQRVIIRVAERTGYTVSRVGGVLVMERP